MGETMIATLSDLATSARSKTSAWQRLPSHMKVLYIATRRRTGGWLAQAFAADSASNVMLEEAIGMTAGLSRLRDANFDAVLVSHENEELNALDLIEGYRAGGNDTPVVVLGTQSEQEMSALSYESGADGYLCVHTATTRNLIWVIARAVQRHQLVGDNKRLRLAEQNRLQREHEESALLLREQNKLLCDLKTSKHGTDELLPIECLPKELIAGYREFLRTYVIMGSGNLGDELRRLAEMLVVAGLSARQTLQLHLHVLEELLHGLGSRSTRHVMNRADLLVLEILLHVGDGYRHRYQERTDPPVQMRLPGF
jgi:DNA-binding response OmpR family regulator